MVRNEIYKLCRSTPKVQILYFFCQRLHFYNLFKKANKTITVLQSFPLFAFTKTCGAMQEPDDADAAARDRSRRRIGNGRLDVAVLQRHPSPRSRNVQMV